MPPKAHQIGFHETVLNKNCSSDLRDHHSSQTLNACQYPLVASKDIKTWFKGVEGCTLNCKHPISDPTQQSIIALIIRTLSAIGLITTLFAILLFICTEKHNKQRLRSPSHMAKVIKRCVICQFLVYLGWSLQMFFNDLACTPNGLPISGLNLTANACVLSFLLTYLPSLSNLLWCAYLGKLCYEKITGASKNQTSSENGADVILSLSSYVLPLVLFMTVVSLSQIDGNGLYGICTIGNQSAVIRIIFVFLPKVVCTLYGNYYFSLTIYEFINVTPMSSSRKRNLARIICLASLNSMDVIFSMWNYLHNTLNQTEFIDSISSYLECKSKLKSYFEESGYVTGDDCTIEKKPVVMLYYLELVSSLGIGIVIASWAFCRSNFKVLRVKLIELLEDDEPKDKKRADLGNQNEDAYQNPIDCTSPSRTEDHEVELCDMDGESISMSNTDSLSRSISISIGTQFSKLSKRYKQGSQFFHNNPLTARDVVNDQRYNRDMRGHVEHQNQSLASNGQPLNFMPSQFPDFQSQQMVMMISELIRMGSNLEPLQTIMVNPELKRLRANFLPLNLDTNYEPPFVHGMVETRKDEDEMMFIENYPSGRKSV